MNIERQLLFPPGIKRLHTDISGASARIGRIEHAQLASRMNTRSFLEANLLVSDALYVQSIEEGRVVTMKPKAGYGYEAIMVVAADKNFFSADANSQISCQTIYDYSPTLQQEYFGQMLAVMLAV